MSAVSRVAVLLAGGVGERVGAGVPKQLIRVGDHTLLEHSLRALEAAGCFDEVLLVMHPDHLAAARLIAGVEDPRSPAAGAQPGARKHPLVHAVIAGGDTRFASSRQAIAYLARRWSPQTRVFLHDAARPFVSAELIARVDTALDTARAVVVGLPVSDTIVEVDHGRVVAVPSRAVLRSVQTPQAFELGLIDEAFRKVTADTVAQSVTIAGLTSADVETVSGVGTAGLAGAADSAGTAEFVGAAEIVGAAEFVGAADPADKTAAEPAVDLDAHDAWVPTDDASVILRAFPTEPVVVVLGDPSNIKVTSPADLAVARRRLAVPGSSAGTAGTGLNVRPDAGTGAGTNVRADAVGSADTGTGADAGTDAGTNVRAGADTDPDAAEVDAAEVEVEPR